MTELSVLKKRMSVGEFPEYEVFTDGAWHTGNGKLSWGYVIYKDSKKKCDYSNWDQGFKIPSANTAEYLGLFEAMEWFVENDLTSREIVFLSDATIVINQMKGLWKIKRPEKGYYPVAMGCRNLLHRFSRYKFVWIPSEKNLAHEIVEKALHD
jgi:ribonuclease HI